MRRVTSALVLIAAAIMPTASQGADKDGVYTVVGPGLTSCQRWVDGRQAARSEQASPRDTNELYYAQMWVLGFITAYNSYVWKGQNVAADADSPRLFAWIDTYCRLHPERNVSIATQDLIVYLGSGARLKEQ